MLHRFTLLLKRFQRDERGAFLVLFGVLALVLVATSGAVVDFTSVEQARTRAQNALDAASLGMQSQIYDESTGTLKTRAQNLLLQQLGTRWTACGETIVPPCASVDTVTVDEAVGLLRLNATITVPTSFVSLVGFTQLSAKLQSETIRGSINIEVALALDTTGSMAGQRIVDLRAATQEFIDLVVQDSQTPTYSKVALVPYSMAVNLDSYAALVRGVPAGPKTITGATWASGTGKSITGATKANPVVITSNAHGFANGDRVYITGVPGMTQLNNRIYIVANRTANTFRLTDTNGVNVNGTSYSTFSNSTPRGRATKCLTSACEVVVTSAAHGFANNDVVYISGVSGMTQLNNRLFTAASVTANTFVLSGVVGTGYSAYVGGGSAYCTKYGCQYRYFQSPQGNWNFFSLSTCVTERQTNAYNDTAPSTTPLGMNYPSSGNPCSPRPIVPLSSNKSLLKAEAAALTAGGSTGGHIGVGWAWYMVSPEFAYLWPTGSRPASYTAPYTKKVVVIMTDGEYNSVYCSGVIAQDSTSGSGSPSDQINCNAPNGDSYTQAEAQCDAMKAAGVEVYTVGFNIVNSTKATALMANCATDASHAYVANSGIALKDAFKDIAQNLGELRVSK